MRGKSVFALALSVFAALCGTPSDVVASSTTPRATYFSTDFGLTEWPTTVKPGLPLKHNASDPPIRPTP